MLLVFAGFALVGAALLYWGIARAPALAARDDNPRVVLSELRIHRGRILDRNGNTLVETVGTPGDYVRRYLYPQAAPVTGYYSLRFGTLGIEASQDATLRGAADDLWQAQWDDWAQRPLRGRDVRLTLDLALQRAADTALGGRRGAVVLLSLPDGGIRALVSHPTYDPNGLDDTFDTLRADPSAPLLNRTTQGLYQPGAALQTVILAAALERGEVALDSSAPNADRPVELRDGRIQCAGRPGESADMADAYAHACPTPFADLGPALGADLLLRAWAQFGFDRAPGLPLLVSTGIVGDLPTDDVALRAAAAGQGDLVITPLHMALVAATVAQNGTQPQPYLIEAVEVEARGGRAWQAGEIPASRPVVTPSVAQALAAAMRQAVAEGAAQGAGLQGMAVAGHAGTALAGPDIYHAWFIGYAPANAPRYALAVLVEGSDEAAVAGQVARGLLAVALR
jgi:peptidoglycan glycosyltransferase